jgi:hypothetical protein
MGKVKGYNYKSCTNKYSFFLGVCHPEKGLEMPLWIEQLLFCSSPIFIVPVMGIIIDT